VPNNKQRREAARRHLQRQLEHRQAQDRRRRQITQLIAAVVGIAVVAAVVIVTLVVTGGGKKATVAGSTTTCAYPSTSAAAAKAVNAPNGSDVPKTGTDTATITTNNGVITATLDRADAPCTVQSFVSLAAQGYFDNTTCHRLTTSGLFVLQCGDPTGTGSGGPGYSFNDELKGTETYNRGVLAMANSGANTNGSQFFLVYGDSTGLSAAYTIFGTISTTGLAVVDTVAAAGVSGGGTDGTPALATTITTVSTVIDPKASASASDTGADTVTSPAASTPAAGTTSP
jgi:peptidyl-prolyl cis-trans isomerase B (cyclophilin B)